MLYNTASHDSIFPAFLYPLESLAFMYVNDLSSDSLQQVKKKRKPVGAGHYRTYGVSLSAYLKKIDRLTCREKMTTVKQTTTVMPTAMTTLSVS